MQSSQKKKYLISISFIFAIFFSYDFIKLLFFDIFNNHLLNFPSNTTAHSYFYSNDNPMIFSWARRSYDNFSILQLGSNIKEINFSYHHLSSRGLGLFLYGLLLNIFSNSITVITIVYIICSFLNFYIICVFFKECKNIYTIFFTILSILFGSKIFGGVLNPFHYYEYFVREIFESKNYYLYFYTSLSRSPNILINNIFIFLNFFLLKKLYVNPINKLVYLITLLLFITSFIDPIIFAVYIFLFFLILFFHKFNNSFSRFFFLKALALIFFLSLTLIFHFYNLKILSNSGAEKHGIGLPHFWMGNPIFAYEMICFPIILFFIFYQNLKKHFTFEIVFLLSLFFISTSSFFLIGEFFSSRITHRNFEIIIASISYLFLYKIITNNLLSKKSLIIFVFFLLHLIYVYIQTSHQIFINYLFFLGSFIAFIFILKKKFKNNIIFLRFFIFFFCIYFFTSLIIYNNRNKFFSEKNEIDQKSFFNWSNNSHVRRTVISLDLGFVLNNELHTNNYVYISNIANVPSKLNRSDLIKRLNDIFYLYGFSVYDLENFLKNYYTKWELDLETFNYDKNNIGILNQIIFFENFQINYDKKIPIKILVDEYKEYLNQNQQNNMNFFDTCVITKYDEKFIKYNSFFYFLKKNKPIYKNSFLSVFDCNFIK